MELYKPIRKLSKIIPYPELQKTQMFVEWKNRLLFVTLAGLVFLGFIAYVPSVILAIKQNFWAVAVIDTIVYLVVLVVTFSSKISGEVKVNTTLLIFYFLGTALLLILGKEGAGFNWLFLFPMLSSFFYGYRGILISTIVNAITLALLFIPVWLNLEQVGLIAEYNTGGWIVNSINFLVITVLLSIGLTIIISNIDKSLRKEKRIIGLLQKSQKQLKREKKRAEESDQLKSAFLANMSHEIRTPLNAIIGFSTLISKPEISKDKIKHYSSLIDMAGNQLIGIINDIIDISKIEHGQMEINIQQMNVYQNLLDIIEIQKSRINALKKNIEIEFSVQEGQKNLTISTDEIRFKQIVNNIVGNAVKYTEAGKISISYNKQKKNGKPVVLFSVKDSGRGIPKDAHKLIFERFAQADNVEFHEGTGLGLAITKGLLDLLGGKIWVKSEPKKGSEFFFTLPLSSSPTEETHDDSTDELLFPPDLKGKIIYIAEDDNFSYTLLREILVPLNPRIKRAKNGKELLELIAQQMPDLVLLDLRMPLLDGFETIREIRKLNYSFPVIAQTAYATPEDRQKCMELGCNDSITKPFRQDELLRTILPWLNQ